MSERTTGATDEQIEAAAMRRAQSEGFPPTDPIIGENATYYVKSYRKYAEHLVPVGLVIAPAADVLTSDQRAAIGRYVVFMDGDNTPYEDDIDLWESDKSIFRAIADGGAK